MAPIISKRNSEKRGETPYTRKPMTNTRERADFGDFSLDFDIVDKLSELLNEGMMFAKNFEMEENRLYMDWVKRKAYLADEDETTIINDNHFIRIDWCNCFIDTTDYLLKHLADPQTRGMAMKMGPNILNQLYKYYELMKQYPPESYAESSVVMEEIDDNEEDDEEEEEEEEEEDEEDDNNENWDLDDDNDEEDDDDANEETPDVSKYTEEDRLILEQFQRLVLGSNKRYEFNGSKHEARHLRRLKEGRSKLEKHMEKIAEKNDAVVLDDDTDIQIIEKEYDVITIDDDDDDDDDDADDEVTLLEGNVDGDEGIPVFGITHPEVNITNARAFEHGKYHVDVTGLRLSTFVDVPRETVTDKDLRSKYRWSNISKEADKDYFFDMVNGSNCTKQSQTMRREPFKQADLLNPLTLAAAMLRQCPCCDEQKAGFNILYPKVCQHFICRSCYVNLVDKYSKIGKHVACPCCGKCINQLFSIVREEESDTGRMVFYNAKLIATS